MPLIQTPSADTATGDEASGGNPRQCEWRSVFEREKALLRRVLPVGIQPPAPLAEQLEMGEVVIHNRFDRNKACLH